MKGHWIAYSAAELAFLAKRKTLPISEFHAAFVEKFGRADVTAGNLHALRKRKGWKTGRTGCFAPGLVPHNKGKPHPCARLPSVAKNQFKKGNLPHNTNYLGHERLSKEGYIEISVDEPNPHTGFERRYVLKHRWLWQKQHGPVPDGMVLKCKGDKTNCDPSNWELVQRALLPRLNGGRHKKRIAYDEAPVELRPTIMAVAKLEQAVRGATSGHSSEERS